MNVFRLSGDVIHAIAILLLLGNISRIRSCSGVSGVAQVLYLITFIARYLDMSSSFFSYYNTGMKHFFIASTAFTVLLVFMVLRRTYDSKHDSKWMFLLLLPPAILSQFANYGYWVTEVAWAFSQYLEAVAMVPQFLMIFSMGQAEVTVVRYMALLACYRFLYICNWIYKYSHGFSDDISFASGSVQFLLYLVFFIGYYMADKATVLESETGANGKEALMGSDVDLPRKGNFVQVKGLNKAFNRLQLIIQRECFGLIGQDRAGFTTRTVTPVMGQRRCETDAESAAQRPTRDNLEKALLSAATAPADKPTPEGSDKAGTDVTA